MTQPIITWMDATHSKEIVAPFDYGVIDADTKSEIRIFNVWNNKGGATDVSKMEDCTLQRGIWTGALVIRLNTISKLLKTTGFMCKWTHLGRTIWMKRALV